MDTQSLSRRLPGRRGGGGRVDGGGSGGAGGGVGAGGGSGAAVELGSPTLVRALTIGAVGVVLDWAGNQFGWWWVTVLTGVAAALLLRGRAMAAFVLAVPLASWGLDLFRRWLEMDTTRVARVTIGLAGIDDNAAWLGYVLTLLYAVLLCAAGAWLTAAVRQVIGAARDVKASPALMADSTAVPTAVPTEQEEAVGDV